jgi:hypothetical protein
MRWSLQRRAGRGAPTIREWQSADNRRRPWLIAATAIDEQTAMMKQTDTDTRTRAPPQSQCIAFNVERSAVQAAYRACHSERKLGSGAKAGMCRNDFGDLYTVAAIECQQCDSGIEHASYAIAFRSRHFGSLGFSNCQPGL